MAKKTEGSAIGGWAFLIGVALAIIISLFGISSSVIVWVLVFIGLIVGLLNVSGDESSHFMMSGVVLIIASALGQTAISAIGVFSGILDNLLLIFVPATIVVAIKNVFAVAKN